MELTDTIRSARAATGLSLSEFAKKSGIDKSSLSLIENGRRNPSVAVAEKILGAAGRAVFTAPAPRRADVASLADLIRRSELLGDWSTSYRAFIQAADNLAAEHGLSRLLVALNEPARISPQWDAALAALSEWRLADEGLPLPGWVAERSGDASWRWAPQASADGWRYPADESHVPEPLLRRGIWVEADELTSA